MNESTHSRKTGAPVKVLMVCLGNICRSPTAEGVLRALIAEAGLDGVIEVDSAGTSDWHRGEPPDHRSQRAAAARGYDLSTLKSRPVVADDFLLHDYILAMDEQNLRDLHSFCPPHLHEKLGLLLEYGELDCTDVPDPYTLDGAAFDHVIDLCEHACKELLQQLIEIHQLVPSGRMR